jgi:hypothetical protein
MMPFFFQQFLKFISEAEFTQGFFGIGLVSVSAVGLSYMSYQPPFHIVCFVTVVYSFVTLGTVSLMLTLK